MLLNSNQKRKYRKLIKLRIVDLMGIKIDN